MDPPALHCASVAVNGDVTLTWSPPTDPGNEFGSYAIYAANAAAGPYVLLSSIGVYAQTTTVHVGANAGLGPRFYYMVTITAGPTPETSLPSDTVSTMFLQVFQSTPPGSADLSWNALAPAPTVNDTFIVWLEYPIGTWTILDSLASTTFAYQHVVSVCEDSLTFRVEAQDGSGCTSFSNRDGDVFNDVTPPTSPTIVAVTVDTTSGLATVEWEPSPEADTDGYIIVFEAGVGAVIIDTVYGQFTTTYEWDESLAFLQSESYTIAAFDTCEVGDPPSPNTSATRPMHRSMFLSHTYDECAALVTLAWTQYVGWTVGTQRIFVQVDGGAWNLLAAVDAGISHYAHTVEPFRTYCYAVEASQEGAMVTTLSNRTCVLTDYPGLPDFNYIRTVTVSGDESITIVDSVDVTATVQGYRLERSDDGGPFEVIAFRPPGLASVLIFIDQDVDPNAVGYRYRVVVIDACGNDALVSNVGGNIVLKAIASLTGENNLNWNGYAQWAGIVQGFTLHRRIEGDPFMLLDLLPPDPWEFADNVSQYTAATGRFCYYVTAVEQGNASGINATSQSNVACAVQEDLVYIPNAFVLGGANPVFRPELAYADVAEYELSIINRWGQVFWTTNDPYEAWDGTMNGKQVPIGVYAYYCNYKNGAGRVFEKRGTVTMLTALD
ncbi:MAG: gliding motility-associated C-terminal domain-containing protein [Flavobacteriales bacterium]